MDQWLSPSQVSKQKKNLARGGGVKPKSDFSSKKERYTRLLISKARQTARQTVKELGECCRCFFDGGWVILPQDGYLAPFEWRPCRTKRERAFCFVISLLSAEKKKFFSLSLRWSVGAAVGGILNPPPSLANSSLFDSLTSWSNWLNCLFVSASREDLLYYLPHRDFVLSLKCFLGAFLGGGGTWPNLKFKWVHCNTWSLLT